MSGAGWGEGGPDDHSTYVPIAETAAESRVCAGSLEVDGDHSWRFDGDDPYIVCVYCGQMQDALTGRVIKNGAKGA